MEPRRSRDRILTYFGLWALGALWSCYVPNLWWRIPAWILIGFCIHGLGDFMHMCSHDRVFHKKGVDRLVGFLCGFPAVVSVSAYRAGHLLHHRYMNTPKDPDCLTFQIPHPGLRQKLIYVYLLVGAPLFVARLHLTAPFLARGWKEKALCVLESTLILSFYGLLLSAAITHGFLPLLVKVWLGGLGCAMLIANTRALAEHTRLVCQSPIDPLQAARTTLTSRGVSFFFNNQNYHLEHHLFPAVPWHNLDQVHQLLRPIYEQTDPSVAAGYVQYLREIFHHGPNAVLSYDWEDHHSHPRERP